MKKKVGLNELSRFVGEQIEEHRKTFDAANIRDFIDIYIDAEKQNLDGEDSFMNSKK